MKVLGHTSILGASSVGQRRPVTLLSGFLGSGKTTLLRRALDEAGERAPAVVVNDFGSLPVDAGLLTRGDDEPVVLAGGCACCTRRDDLAQALATLLEAEQRFLAPRREVVIETSGLSDPGPIAFTIANDPVLKHHYTLARVCVTVDALSGLTSIERHPVAMRQLLAADDLFVTKADLASAAHTEEVVRRLRATNPTASVSVTAHGKPRRTETADVQPGDWSAARAPAAPAHTEGIATVELATQEPLDWQAFAIWLSLLVHRYGPDVLRVKALLDVRDIGPVALHGVQHIIHRPEHLPGPPPELSRIVLIVRNIDPRLLERSFHTFLRIP